MSEDREFITKERAIELIGQKQSVHTFLQAGPMLIGADWSWKDLNQTLDKAKSIEIGGEQCQRMKHPIVVDDGSKFIFIEATNFGALNATP